MITSNYKHSTKNRTSLYKLSYSNFALFIAFRFVYCFSLCSLLIAILQGANPLLHIFTMANAPDCSSTTPCMDRCHDCGAVSTNHDYS